MMAEFYRWLLGSIMVAGGTISVGYGACLMWRAWRAVS